MELLFLSICLAAWAYLLPTRSAGQTWNLQTTGRTLNGIWMLNSSTGWVVGDFGTIWNSSDQPLPVKLLRFTAHRELAGVRLHWQTAIERNNAGFCIERSADGIRYHDIGFAPGTRDRLSDQLGTLKQASPLTDNHLDLNDLPPGVYCLWLLDGSAETRVARMVKR